VLKDNTLMPGEWYGGLLHFDAPVSDGERSYRILIEVGPDRHAASGAFLAWPPISPGGFSCCR
jgi:hypothetical protein